MDTFAIWLQRLTKAGALLGGFFLIVALMILISNILGRFMHFVFSGSYEVFELIMVVPVSFALVYAAWHNAHVNVTLIVSQFPPRLRAATEIIVSILHLAVWVLIAWAVTHLAFENGLNEVTDLLNLPYLPSRIVFSIGLCLFCLICLWELYQAIRRFLGK